ncbi:CAP domain-containing protein [Rhizobium halophilum]|uniref:CAP domain-containing protein n=1 Tax=Rhizobium halophilum TaxID=2846852 RepID=UPI001EFD2001|nr:CAP domain-containing protein [Rhizobium halophilum]MCF6370219.1 CAP domain-containing protein [Rhizobium halophilum]
MIRKMLSFKHSALVVASLLSLVLWAGPVLAQQTGDLDRLRQIALQEVNADRQENGLDPLRFSDNLNEAAMAHATDMLARNYYSHTSPEGGDVQDRYVEAGGSPWRLVAENISRCTGCTQAPDAADVMRLQEGWMNSPGHRENILRSGISRFGFAVVSDTQDGLYAVQTFAGAGTPRGSSDAVSAVDSGNSLSTALMAINDLREEAGREPLSPSEDLSAVASRLVPDDVPDPSNLPELNEASSDLDHGRWSQLSTIVGACGGCGAEPTQGDIQAFIGDWAKQSTYRKQLLDEGVSHLGFVIRANGEGKKVAAAILGQAR